MIRATSADLCSAGETFACMDPTTTGDVSLNSTGSKAGWPHRIWMLQCWLSAFVAWLILAGTVRADKPIEVLFLGDNGHHRPADRFAQLEPVMAARGIQLTYADQAEVLSETVLAPYSAIVIYANHDAITPSQEKALLEFVGRGKGLIALHCASYCFRNSPKYIELVGGQFAKHGGEVFRVTPAQPVHPLLVGYTGFESWDETYIHTQHHVQDRTVLEYRKSGEQAAGETAEPWTWLKPYAGGRVFYTAWGHDERTWSQPGFANLVERGIRWASGATPEDAALQAGPMFDGGRPAFEPLAMTSIDAELPPFKYVDVGPKIPNYRAKAQWGTQDAPLAEMQQPVSAEESLKHYSVPEGMHLELFAAEPLIGGKPIAMAWDDQGRLLISETMDYPNELQPAGAGRDRICLVTDTDGDGKGDKRSVFADGLSIPTTLVAAWGGVIVNHATETLFLKDTNGDGRADVREVLISDWNHADTHAGVSNFQYGLDGWIWGMQGYNNSQPTIASGRVAAPFRMGFFRFRLGAGQKPGIPEVKELEFVRSTDNNTWGLGFSEEGIVFGSTANHNPSNWMPIPNSYYEQVRGWGPDQLHTIADSYLFKAITSKLRQVDQHGGYTAAAGHALYTARNYPEQFWNRTAFVCEPTGHLVGTFVLSPSGSGFKATSPMNLVASDDEWAAPIMAEVGPDGNVWILDWYNYIVQHNPTPAGFETGAGGAYESELRDKKHGRVYRLVMNDGPTSQSPRLDLRNPKELVQSLTHDNMLWRLKAQQLLHELHQTGKKTQVEADLIQLVQNRQTDALQLNVGAIHALWTLKLVGMLEQGNGEALAAVFGALTHPAAGVRRNAVQVLPASELAKQRLLASGVLQDSDLKVRLAAALALADQPADQRVNAEVGTAITQGLMTAAGLNDRWLSEAFTAAASVHQLSFVAALGRLSDVESDQLRKACAIVAEHVVRGRPDAKEFSQWLLQVANTNGSIADAIVVGMTKGWPRGHQIRLSDEADQKLVQWLLRVGPESKGALAGLAANWDVRALRTEVARIRTEIAARLADSTLDVAPRLTAAESLVQLDSTSDETAQLIVESITAQTPSDLAVGLVDGLKKSAAPELGSMILARMDVFTPTVRQAAIKVLLTKADTTSTLLDGVAAGQVMATELALDQKQALVAHPTEAIRDRAKELMGRLGGIPNADRQQIIEQYASATRTSGDAEKGKAIYKQQCAKCHLHSGMGQKIGPELTGMAVHPKHELLVHILDPSRSVEGNFRIYSAVVNDGRVVTGMLAGESKTTVELIDAEARRISIAREDLEELRASPKSLMPEGFEKQIPLIDMTDLLEFLTQRGKYIPLMLDKVASANSTRGLFYDSANELERLDFGDWSTKVFQGVPFRLIDGSDGVTPNCVLFYGPLGSLPPKMPKVVALGCESPVRMIHLLSGVGGWSYPAIQDASVSLIVRVKYTDGEVEEHELRNGVHFADYIRQVDVPESVHAFKFPLGQQMRYLTVAPKRMVPLREIELVKGPDDTAPIVMAVTVETP